MKIDVKKIMSEPERISFFKDPGYDTIAAAERLAKTEKFFKEWHASVNQIQTRDLPEELWSQYNRAADALCMILAIEKQIILKGGER